MNMYPVATRLSFPFACLLLSLVPCVTNLAQTCVPPPPGLIGWWPGNGNANDATGQNDGVLQGGATARAGGVVGTAFHFNGTGYVMVPDAPSLRPQTLSVEVWVRFDTLNSPGTSPLPGQQYIVFRQNSRGSDFEGFVLSKDRVPRGDVFLWEATSAQGKLIRLDSITTIIPLMWYHVVGVRTPKFLQLYVNGRLEAQKAIDFPQDYGNSPLFFGSSGQPYYDRKLKGSLDEVSLYNRPLNAVEVATLYQAGAAGKCRSYLRQPLTVLTTGEGTVRPNYNGKWLNVGATYRMTAQPRAGHVFVNWSGDVSATTPTLTFVMQKNLTLQANFVPSPFAPVAGTYRGTFQDPNTSSPTTAGSFTLVLTAKGTFSGSLKVGAARYALSGRFDSDGQASVTIPRLSQSPLKVQLQLDLANGTGQLAGSVSTRLWTADLTGSRAG